MDRRMRKLGVDNITASYLKLQSVKENRGNVLCFVMMFLNFFGLFPLIGEPFIFSLFIIGFIPTMIMNIWGILYIVDPYRFELSYYLYFGIYGFVNTFVYSLVLVKILYFWLGIQEKWLVVFILLFVNSLPFFANWLNYKMLYAGTYDKLQKKKNWRIPILLLPPSSGYILYQLTDSYGGPSASMILFFICILMLTVFTAYFSTNVHKYFFLKNNMTTVLKVFPSFGQPKHIQYAWEIEEKRRKKYNKGKAKRKKKIMKEKQERKEQYKKNRRKG